MSSPDSISLLVERSGLARTQAAEAIGVSTSMLRRYEHGLAPMPEARLSVLRKLSEPTGDPVAITASSDYSARAFAEALMASELATGAKAVGLILSLYADGDSGHCKRTRRQLAADSSQSERTVRRATIDLKAAGFMCVAKCGDTQYQLRIPPALDEPKAPTGLDAETLAKLEKYDMAVALGLIED